MTTDPKPLEEMMKVYAESPDLKSLGVFLQGLLEWIEQRERKAFEAGFNARVDEGRKAAAQAERAAILKMVEEICDEDVADAVTFGQYATANDLLAQLKQRIGI